MVFRSLKHISAQLVNDDLGVTLLGVTDTSEGIAVEGTGKVARAKAVGQARRREGEGRRLSPRWCSTGRVTDTMAACRRSPTARAPADWSSSMADEQAVAPGTTTEAPSEQPQRRGRGGRGEGGRDRGPRRDRDRSPSDHVENVIAINRVAKVVKGGRRFSFNALVAVGDGKGKVGVATGKANEVSEAVRKAVDAAKRNMIEVPRTGATIPARDHRRARRRPRAAQARRHRYRRHRRRPDPGRARRAPASPTS